MDRYDDGYVLTTYPPLTETQLTVRGLTSAGVDHRLRGVGIHPRDAVEAVWNADRRYSNGTTDALREIVRIGRRAKLGEASPQDLELIRRELRERKFELRETYLINALYMAGQGAEAIRLILNMLEQRPDAEDVQLALGFLARWAPDSYADVAIPFIRGTVPEAVAERGWAITYASSVLKQGRGRGLLDELARIATDESEPLQLQRQARYALSWVAGFDIGDTRIEHIASLPADSPTIDELIQLARNRAAAAEA